MPVTNIYVPKRVNGDGVNKDFTFNFLILDETDLKINLVNDTTNVKTPQDIVDDYTVAFTPGVEGGTVSYIIAPPSTEDSLIERDIATIQPTQLPDVGTVRESQFTTEYDRSRMIDQEVEEIQSRNLKIAVEDSTIMSPAFNSEIEQPVNDKFQIWDASTSSFKNSANTETTLAAGAINAAASAAAAAISASQAATSASNAADSEAVVTNLIGAVGGLVPTEQSTPDNTVFVTEGSYRNPIDSSTHIFVANNVASGVTYPVVSADSRIDLSILDEFGVASRIAGVEAASPVAPIYPIDKIVVAEVTIDETVTVIITDSDIKNVVAVVGGGPPSIETEAIAVTRAVSAGDSVQTISHNLGRIPKRIYIYTGDNSGPDNWGSSTTVIIDGDGTIVGAALVFVNNGNISNTAAPVAIFQDGASDSYTGTVTAVDEDEIDITWSTINSPAFETLALKIVPEG